ncbi:MAG: alcohol dehydrogenase catalytic domain-containing protein [Thermoplasmataceae archaeon]
MKALVLRKPLGIENLNFEDVPDPVPKDDEVLVKVLMSGLNPIDYGIINGRVIYNVTPMPHIPGAEAVGVVMKDHGTFREGDRVIIYNRVYDGTCPKCLGGNEHLCINGGIWSVVSNGGYSEMVSVKAVNLFPIPKGISNEVAVSLPVGALTAYRALKRASSGAGKKLLVYGASGNTGIFLTQLGNIMGMEVYGVTRKTWTRDFGAHTIYDAENIPSDFKADIVVNSIGSGFWNSAMSHLDISGTLVTFGVQTGKEATIDISQIYSREYSIVGSTGGTRKDFHEVMEIAEKFKLKVRVSDRFQLGDYARALKRYEEIRDGRVILLNNR